MAKEKETKPVEAKKPSGPKMRYFRNAQFAALRVRTGEDESKTLGPRFTPYTEVFQGDVVKVGYLECSGGDAEAVAKTQFTEEISEKEFNEATKRSSKPVVEKAPKE